MHAHDCVYRLHTCTVHVGTYMPRACCGGRGQPWVCSSSPSFLGQDFFLVLLHLPGQLVQGLLLSLVPTSYVPTGQACWGYKSACDHVSIGSGDVNPGLLTYEGSILFFPTELSLTVLFI